MSLYFVIFWLKFALNFIILSLIEHFALERNYACQSVAGPVIYFAVTFAITIIVISTIIMIVVSPRFYRSVVESCKHECQWLT